MHFYLVEYRQKRIGVYANGPAGALYLAGEQDPEMSVAGKVRMAEHNVDYDDDGQVSKDWKPRVLTEQELEEKGYKRPK